MIPQCVSSRRCGAGGVSECLKAWTDLQLQPDIIGHDNPATFNCQGGGWSKTWRFLCRMPIQNPRTWLAAPFFVERVTTTKLFIDNNTTHLTRNSSHTTHLILLISHYSSHTTHLSHRTPLAQLISHHSSHANSSLTTCLAGKPTTHLAFY